MQLGWRQRIGWSEIDTRGTGIFRIALGVMLLADQLARMANWSAFHGVGGIASYEMSQQIEGPWVWSVYWLTQHQGWPILLEAARLAATLLLIAGIRSRLMAGILFVLVVSLANHNPMILQGGDRVLIVTVFFAVFLPLGGRYSLEALWHGREERRSVQSLGTGAYTLQVLLVFFMAGIMKTDPRWTTEFTAVSMSLHLEAFVTETGRLWREYDTLAQVMSFIVIWIEWLAPVVTIVPFLLCRMIGVGALLVLEVGILFSLEVGLFPFISIVSLLPLIPANWWDIVLKGRGERGRGWTLYYDQDCRFCIFAARLLKAVCGWENAAVRKAQACAEANRILDERGSWSIVKDGQREYTPGWEAVQRMLRESGRGWIASRLPEGEKGAKWYRWIGEHRSTFGRTGKAVFGTKRWRVPGVVGETIAGVSIGLVLAWNIATYPAVREHIGRYEEHVAPWIGIPNIRQYWTMFAPAPFWNDWWWIGMGLTRDGRIVSVFTEEEMPREVTPPKDGPTYYGSHRWRKLMNYLESIDQVEHVLRYWCRTRKWQGISVWIVWRENIGTHETATQPYKMGEQWRWTCGEANQDQMREFEAEVTEYQEDGVQIGPSDYIEID